MNRAAAAQIQDDAAIRQRRAKCRVTVALAAACVVGTVIARKRGYRVGGNTPVRCRDGHLFTTLWIPGVNLKALDLVVARFQYCPVGRHWALVRPVRPADLSPQEREAAASRHDVMLP